MTLDDSEAPAVYAAISKSLHDSGLSWVVTQVEEKLALGKLRSETIKVSEPHFDEGEEPSLVVVTRSRRVSRKATFTVAEEYSPTERVSALLEGLVLAVPVLNDIAHEAAEIWAKMGSHGGIAFRPEARVREEFFLDSKTVEPHLAAGQALITLLDELSGENRHADKAGPPSGN